MTDDLPQLVQRLYGWCLRGLSGAYNRMCDALVDDELCVHCQAATALDTLTRALAEQQWLVEERTEGLARIQQHRDAWRRYAYTGETKPTDFLDGNQVDRTETLIEELRDRLTAAMWEARVETDTTARLAVVAELRAVASWMAEPGHIWKEDAVDECRRVLRNRAQAIEHEGAPLHAASRVADPTGGV